MLHFFGVLSPGGSIKSVDGLLSVIIVARKESFKILHFPYMNNLPLAHIDGIEFRFVETLQMLHYQHMIRISNTYSVIKKES